jgi:arylamine N-acetyltransferase
MSHPMDSLAIMGELDVAAYLTRLGLGGDGSAITSGPSVAALFALHAAHVERVPYETLDFQLGHPISIDPHESAARIIGRRGGYCFLLNGAFSLLLAALGYDVRLHRGGVQGLDNPRPVGADGNHLALTVHGLATAQAPDGTWLVDVGLGDALHHPIPLRPGRYQQGPFEYRLRSSEAEPGGWRLDHDPAGTFAGMDFTMDPADLAGFAEMHQFLSASPDSHFVRIASVQRRHRYGVDALRGCRLRTLTATGSRDSMLTTPELWYTTLAEVFGLALDDLTPNERTRLWSGVFDSHQRWIEEATCDA